MKKYNKEVFCFMTEQSQRKKECFPDFLLLGAAKCGTTSLHAWLDQHPDILMSNPKEPFFFVRDFEKGLDSYWEKYFNGWKGEKFIGEASPHNLLVPYVPERIHSVNPDARLIIMVRNPVYRALSHWWMDFCNCVETKGFKEAIEADNRDVFKGGAVKGFEDYEKLTLTGYLHRGYYAEQLERYFEFFPRTQCKIIFFKDIIEDAKGVTSEICEFIGADPLPCDGFDYSEKNKAPELIWQWSPKRIRMNFSKQVLKNFTYHTEGSTVASALKKLRRRPSIVPELKKWLVEHYKPHNRRLEEITGRDLSSWDN